MDAMMHLAMQKMIASGQIQASTEGFGKRIIMLPGNGFKMTSEPIAPIQYYIEPMEESASNPTVERSVATDSEKTSPADPQK